MLMMSPLLRLALLIDAVATAATGLLMFAGGATVAPLTGLPPGLLYYAGLLLLPYAAGIGYLASRAAAPSVVVWAIIAGNAAWTLDSLLLLVTGWVAPTPLGYGFVVGQALAVAAFAELQYVGLRRSPVRGGAGVMGS
jgi:hypothetical protein